MLVVSVVLLSCVICRCCVGCVGMFSKEKGMIWCIVLLLFLVSVCSSVFMWLGSCFYLFVCCSLCISCDSVKVWILLFLLMVVVVLK